ncbi:hypothetical protein [Proteiniphilum sp. X52]|uniref:hypothetical protein n=1 Tax=Proteiniphilum sp. X52 TaxID=2382159 RepID=UPI000F09AC29|nr:hypothetical protein [Proteiniphilum sp. X52]RNC67026.1 hypothetical protein D7D25_01940 [Proteiniphilum sp. X52]
MNVICEKTRKTGSSSDAVYALGLIGAAIYFISTATTFWMGVLGFLKAIVWPAFLVYEAFRYLLA